MISVNTEGVGEVRIFPSLWTPLKQPLLRPQREGGGCSLHQGRKDPHTHLLVRKNFRLMLNRVCRAGEEQPSPFHLLSGLYYSEEHPPPPTHISARARANKAGEDEDGSRNLCIA